MLYTIMPPASSDHFNIFPIYFSCLIGVVRTLNIMLNSNGENEHPFFVHALRGRVKAGERECSGYVLALQTSYLNLIPGTP